MAVIKQGILGGVSGKVGTVIGGSWKGIDYVRSIPTSVANPKTEDQLDQRSKFNTVLKFLQATTGFIQTGFKNYAVGMTAFNAAMSYNLKNGITGTYPNFTIDFNNALISRGSLAPLANTSIIRAIASEIELRWVNNSYQGNANDNDIVMYLIYVPVSKTAIFSLNEARRVDGNIYLSTPSQYSGETAHFYLSAMSADGKSVANSVYLGSQVI